MLTPTQNIDLAAPILVAAQNLARNIAAAQVQIDRHNADKNNSPIDASFVSSSAAHSLAIVQALAVHIGNAAAPAPAAPASK